MSRTTSIRLSPQMQDRVKALQQQTGRTQTDVLAELIEIGLEVLSQTEEIKELMIARAARTRKRRAEAEEMQREMAGVREQLGQVEETLGSLALDE